MSDRGGLDTSGFSELSHDETEAMKVLATRIALPQEISHRGHILIGRLTNSVRESPEGRRSKAANATIRLLNRASDDLRCAAILADYGYPTQVASQMAAFVEAIFAAAYIRNHEERAEFWFSHDDKRKTPWDVKTMILDVLQTVGRADLSDVIYGIYRELCMPKHSNPVYQKFVGVEETASGPMLQNGPDVSEYGIYVIWYSLIESVQAANFSITAIAAVFDRDRALSEIGPPIAELLDRARGYRVEVKARGWD